jgi:hypothetical protein
LRRGQSKREYLTTFFDKLNRFLQCEPGKVSANPGATTCITCPSGTYTNAAVGATECVGCAAGSFSMMTGSASVDNCQQVRMGGGEAVQVR